ncbi:HNH endonuclease [Xenorhabdus bovienii]|uniref:HNH endonuclease n=1 Tax=Xenorhabdus bovienii TaxID=40576 RepID=UPI003BAAFD01
MKNNVIPVQDKHCSKNGEQWKKFLVIRAENQRPYKPGCRCRIAWLYVYGFMPKIIDHINRIRNGNRITNLRECDFSENARNRKIQTNNKSGINGVH